MSFITFSSFATGAPPSGPAGGALAGTYPSPTIVAGAVGTAELGSGAVISAKVDSSLKDAAGTVASMRTLGSGATQAAAGNHTHAESDVSGLVAALALANKRALFLGRSGTVSATLTDAADFYVQVPFDMTLTGLKVTAKTPPTGAMAVQLRSGSNSGTPTFSNLANLVVTFVANRQTAGTALGTANYLNVSEGDVLNFSVSTGSGAALLVEACGVVR